MTITDNAMLCKTTTTFQFIEQVDKCHDHLQTMVHMTPFMSALVYSFNADKLQDQTNCEEHTYTVKNDILKIEQELLKFNDIFIFKCFHI